MRIKRLAGVALVSAVTAVMGCDGAEDEAQVTPPAQEQTTADSGASTPPAGGGTAQPQGEWKPGGPAERPQQSQQQQAAEATSPPPAAQPSPGVTNRPQQPQQPLGQATGAPPPPPNTPEAKARALLDQMVVQIGENKFDDAEKTLAELKRMRGTLPREMRDEIDNAGSSLEAAKVISNQTK